MTTLLVGYDSAWTPTNRGALVGVLHMDDGTFRELGWPQAVNYTRAEEVILRWQAELVPGTTIVLIDQPNIVKNTASQRPVEKIVGFSVGRRYGGMRPANTSKEAMVGAQAPIWRFLTKFGGPANPLEPITETRVFETYPVLAMIALRWMLADSRAGGARQSIIPRKGRAFLPLTGSMSAGWLHMSLGSAD